MKPERPQLKRSVRLPYREAHVEEIKRKVLNNVVGQREWVYAGRSNVIVDNKVIHVRFRSKDPKCPEKYIYNINPNTLRADFELWICQTEDIYYLFPIDVIRTIYFDLDTHEDKTHPEIRVASINITNHLLKYGRRQSSIDATNCFKATLTNYAI